MEGRKAELTTAINFKGSPRWCSPEALLETGKTLKSDIWSWGCLALEVRFGKLLGPTSRLQQVKVSINYPR